MSDVPTTNFEKNSAAIYELLREKVIKQSTHFSSGYLKLIRDGLLVWMQLDLKLESDIKHSINPRPIVNPISQRNEPIIQILTNMVMNIQREAYHASI